MKPLHERLHRCHYCGMASLRHIKVICNPCISSVYVYICQSRKACEKRQRAQGKRILRRYALNLNPPPPPRFVLPKPGMGVIG
jgi:hypothetical protein